MRRSGSPRRWIEQGSPAPSAGWTRAGWILLVCRNAPSVDGPAERRFWWSSRAASREHGHGDRRRIMAQRRDRSQPRPDVRRASDWRGPEQAPIRQLRIASRTSLGVRVRGSCVPDSPLDLCGFAAVCHTWQALTRTWLCRDQLRCRSFGSPPRPLGRLRAVDRSPFNLASCYR